MRLRVDMEVCTGHGRCYMEAPDLFDEDEAGYCVLKMETVPEELLAQAQRGVDVCPERAIELVD